MLRNLIIEAGAGTGKTTRLVKAVIDALLTRELSLEGVVALTFTNKAAGELKDRVSHALNDVLAASRIDELREKPWWPAPGPASTLQTLQELARAAQSVLDRAPIGTIHSFAFSLLKRFPVDSGIDPDSRIDDKGLELDEIFRNAWPGWLKSELGESAPREADWLALLEQLPLSRVAEAARRLADFEISLNDLEGAGTSVAARLRHWHTRAQALSAAHAASTRPVIADRLAAACEEILGAAARAAETGTRLTIEALSAECRDSLLKNPGTPRSWTPEELEELQFLKKLARNAFAEGDRTIALLLRLLAPFIALLRQRLLREGILTHAALLTLSRNLVRDQLPVRQALKKNIRMILVDEFQDTDPQQAELLLYLAERGDRAAKQWTEVEVEPGKLFVVGDPKQSIYRFRGADIAAYDDIVQLLLRQNGARETLAVNYRTQAQIIDGVNAAFETIIREEAEISPRYSPVTAHHPHRPERALQNFELWLADSAQKQSTSQAQTTEAEAIAEWINAHVGTLEVQDPREGARPLTYRDIALIYRTYNPMDRALEAFKRRDIPFAVESERYFFTTPEVTDVLNLLRAAADPEDAIALVGYLRSPLAGLTDETIAQHRQSGRLESLDATQRLRQLGALLDREPLDHVLQRIFREFFLLELAARSYHGDQAVANLLKLRRILEVLSSRGRLTLEDLLHRLDDFFQDDTIEGESPLADENYDAVRLLTVHKAKGLEFPVVFLPGLQSEVRGRGGNDLAVDWRRREWGLTIANVSTTLKLELDRRNARREAAEENRILYVAMTRARERLVLSGGLNLKSTRASSYLNRLVEAWGLSLGTLPEGLISAGPLQMQVRRLPRVIPAPVVESDTTNPVLKAIDPVHFASAWKVRYAAAERVKEVDVVVTPSLLADKTTKGEEGGERGERISIGRFSHPPSARAVGTLVHRFLEHWDFTCKKCDMPARLREIAGAALDPALQAPVVIDTAQKLLAAFIGSPAWTEIAEGTVLAREMPFFCLCRRDGGSEGRSGQAVVSPTPCHSDTPIQPLLRGTLDLLYRRKDGTLVVADYKTDEIPAGASLADLAAPYAPQLAAYCEAVQAALGESPETVLIFVRTGQRYRT